MNAPVIVFQWDGEAMRPLRRFHNVCNAEYVVGEFYRCEVIEERSTASHRHHFAWLKDAWLNLPEALADLYPSPEHLRKRALIEAGFYTESIVDAGTNAAALRVAAMARTLDEFAVAIVRGPAVVVRRAKSQSYRTMGRKEFNESKQAIREVVANLIGVTPEELDGSRAA